MPVTTILIGTIGGLLSGLFGIGGGLVMVPLMVFILHFSQLDAQGTVLAAMVLPVGLWGVFLYHRGGHVHISSAALLVIGLVGGTAAGALLAQHIPVPILKKSFAVLLIAAGFRYLFV